MLASSLDGPRLSELANDIAALTNPALFFNLRGADPRSPEYRANLQGLLNEQAELLRSAGVAGEVEAVLRSIA